MEREEFAELAKNDMPAALLWLYDQSKVAEEAIATIALGE